MMPDWMERGHPVGDGYRLVVSVSGGKDSVATCLHLMELGYTPDDYDRIFMDTGWESSRSYEYLREVLPSAIGPITWLRAEIPLDGDLEALALKYEARLGHYSSMVRRIIKHSSFPSRMARWCTRALKLNPAKAFIRGVDAEPVNVVGIRGEESARRARMAEHEWSDDFDCWVWRPLIGWTFDDVVGIHQRHGLRPNPLYFEGSSRVGCWPCVFARKSEIKNTVETDPDRLAIIRDLERDVALLLSAKRREQGKPEREDPTWFQARTGRKGFWPIDKVAQWSRTSRGGRQFELFSAAPRDAGCVRWGMCDLGGDGDG